MRKKGRTSFLKKRSKKLLRIAGSRCFKGANQVPTARGKSFLVLFSKNGLLYFRRLACF
jgi:hypothetical protein